MDDATLGDIVAAARVTTRPRWREAYGLAIGVGTARSFSAGPGPCCSSCGRVAVGAAAGVGLAAGAVTEEPIGAVDIPPGPGRCAATGAGVGA